MRMPRSSKSRRRILIGRGSSKIAWTHPSGAPSGGAYAHPESSANTKNSSRPMKLFTFGSLLVHGAAQRLREVHVDDRDRPRRKGLVDLAGAPLDDVARDEPWRAAH